MSLLKSICLIGFGEVGSTLARDLLCDERCIYSYDIAFKDTNSKASKNRQEVTGVLSLDSLEDAVKNADLVISVVTAEQAMNAAESVSRFIRNDSWYLDLNSVAPQTKQGMAKLFKGQVKFVEGAIMSPIHPQKINAPILLGGPNAQAFSTIAKNIGFTGSEFFSAQLGKSAASKMCRSVIIKGMESLITESLVSARYYGVEDQVINSLNNLLPGINWQQHSAYMISRSLEHGVRRAEEMSEVHKTVTDAGLPGLMSKACVDTQAWTARFNQDVTGETIDSMLDQFRTALSNK
ncbi:DUF1932 domain-containing protein [Aurantivibrio infirmus]